MRFRTLWFEGKKLFLLDQRKLPGKEETVVCSTPEEVADAIKNMTVRGAPAIGVAAAYGMALAEITGVEKKKAAELLKSTRPTARNLSWAVERCLAAKSSLSEAKKIHEEETEVCRRIGENGKELIPENAKILTHCNAGILACPDFGTALSPIYLSHSSGKKLHVFVDETRPRLQGAKLTAWELKKNKVSFTLICDSAAGYLMQKQKIDLVLVGADRIAKNGDTANKIGTYSLAVLAKYHGVPFHVATPFSTIDFSLTNGSGIVIEERDASELRTINGVPTAPECDVWNPAFDVTPSHLITSFITERGIFKPTALKNP